MAGVKVDTPPIGIQIVDPQTGMPTRAMADFMHRLWERSGGNDDASDFILKLLTGSRQESSQAVEATQQDKDFSRPSDARVGEVQKKIDSIERLAAALTPTTFDPSKAKIAFDAKVPKRGIIAFSGSVSEIPRGWFLCDGTNGTPDLRDRFIIGASATRGVGDTGGQEEYKTNREGAAGWDFFQAVYDESIPTMPPWYALALIMKG